MKKTGIILLVLLVILSVSCTNKKTTETSIADYTEEEILNGNSYSRTSSFTSTVNKKTTIKCKRFTGFEKIMIFQQKEDSIKITLTATVDDGEFRLVICDSEKIYHEFEINEENQTYTLPAAKNKYYLKAVGKNASYKLEVTYETTEPFLPKYEGTTI